MDLKQFGPIDVTQSVIDAAFQGSIGKVIDLSIEKAQREFDNTLTFNSLSVELLNDTYRIYFYAK